MSKLPLVFLLSFLCLSSGCSSGSGNPVCYPISGKVLFNQQPIAEAQVVLYPKTGSISPLPMGYTDEKGQFTITTWATGDGAPAGDYVVTVSWKALELKGEEKIRSGRQLLSMENTDPHRSPWKYTVKEGGNAPLVIDIKK